MLSLGALIAQANRIDIDGDRVVAIEFLWPHPSARIFAGWPDSQANSG
jgi:hypothetical protein